MSNANGGFVSVLLTHLFNFVFIPCGRLSWLPVSFTISLHVKYSTHYRIVSYRIVVAYNSRRIRTQAFKSYQFQRPWV